MRCTATTQKGGRCKKAAVPRSRVCRTHLLPSVNQDGADGTLRSKHALYYPFIEVPNERWLKTAALYWETLSTIVPDGLQAYRTGTAAAFHEAEILDPVIVAPGLREVEDACDDVLAYLGCDEGRQMLEASSTSRVKVHVRKFADRLRVGSVHRSKMSSRLYDALQRLGLSRSSRGPWLRVPEPFAYYYMTVLATHLSRRRGATLSTDMVEAEPLAGRVIRGDVPGERRVPRGVAEGLLASIALRSIELGPRTPARKIVSFREKHEVELGRFRNAVRRLTAEMSSDVGLDVLRNHVETIYSDEVAPSVDELRDRLRDNRIACGFNNLKASALMSASPTALGFALMATPIGPYALAAGAGLSVVLSIANYRVQRREILRGNPYSYILAAEKFLGKGRSQGAMSNREHS